MSLFSCLHRLLRIPLSLCLPFVSLSGSLTLPRLTLPVGLRLCSAVAFSHGAASLLCLGTRKAFPCLSALQPPSCPPPGLFHPFLPQHQWPSSERPFSRDSPPTLRVALRALTASAQACLSPVRTSAPLCPLPSRCWSIYI